MTNVFALLERIGDHWKEPERTGKNQKELELNGDIRKNKKEKGKKQKEQESPISAIS